MLPLVAVAFAAVAGCSGGAARKPDITFAATDNPAHGYVDPRPVGTYPSSPGRIQGWIDAGQPDSIRAHGWDIWRSITTTVDTTPTWQTWYSGQEIFDSVYAPMVSTRPGRVRLPLERARQVTHRIRALAAAGHRIPVDTFERVFAFNRFTSSTATYIWGNHLNDANVLAGRLAAMWGSNVPLAGTQVITSADSVDPRSFVIKCVFQFIRGDTVTAIPYWAGYDPAHSDSARHPPPRFWRQAVAVDPTGRLKPGDTVTMAFNGQSPQVLRVVPLSAFYAVKVTVDDSAHLTQFGSENGDDLGFNSDTSQAAVDAAARPGNYGLLMAMHVTGKEIVNWTWQSFWWTPNPTDSLRSDQPAGIPAPWNSYAMTTAYAMLTPSGQPNVAFNPYLETSLAGTTEAGVNWTGITTNCMSCHRRAAIAYQPTINAPLYGPAALVNPGDSVIFTYPWTIPAPIVGPITIRAPFLKTDFLWSVAIRAQPPDAHARARVAAVARERAAAAAAARKAGRN